jgi:hypothetical protein
MLAYRPDFGERVTPMTEQEWQETFDSGRICDLVGNTFTGRKKLLAGCAAARLGWDFVQHSVNRRAIEITERYADGLASFDELKEAWGKIIWEPAMYHEWPMRMLTDLLQPGGIWPNANEIDDAALRDYQEQRGHLWLGRNFCEILRHIFGNPFKPYTAPASWPSTVVQLAASLYEGQDCRLPLSDALEESGHGELAEHFRKESWHPKGCWVLDLISGKQ